MEDDMMISGITAAEPIVNVMDSMNLKRFVAPDGYMLTNFKDGDNILYYFSGVEFFTTIDMNDDTYRCVSYQEDREYKYEQADAFNNLFNN